MLIRKFYFANFATTQIFIVPVFRSRDLIPRNCQKSCDPNAPISSVTNTFKDRVKQSFKTSPPMEQYKNISCNIMTKHCRSGEKFHVKQIMYFLAVFIENYYIIILASFLSLQCSRQTQFHHNALCGLRK